MGWQAECNCWCESLHADPTGSLPRSKASLSFLAAAAAVVVPLQKHQEDAVSAMVLVRRYLTVPGLAVRVRLRGG